MIHDVVIVGAGPVGLLLACELRLAGASVQLLERAEHPRAPLKEAPFGLRGLSVATVEALDRRGLLAAVAAGGTAGHPAGHFAGITWDEAQVKRDAQTYRLPGPADRPLATTMEQLETVLSERATTLGVLIDRGVQVDGVDQSEACVSVHGAGRAYPARWAVGCDGGRSVVRKSGGFEFVGTEPRFTGYSVHVDLADGRSLPLGRHYTPTGMYVQSRRGVFALADFDGGAAHRRVPVTAEHIQAVLRRIAGVDVTVTALHLATTWTDRARQVTEYRRGRILLAGDAAHVHSPLGGQGLNLGLGDAMNLGWKLGAVVRGVAPASLLDEYGSERHPVGADVLDWSRAQVLLLEPTDTARAMAGVVRDLIATSDGATYFAQRSSGVSVRYALPGRHPLIGRSAPDFVMVDGTRLGEFLRAGLGVLLDIEGHDALRGLGAQFEGELQYVRSRVVDGLGLRAILVRPDGVVAWVGEGEPDIGEVREALSQWICAGGATSVGRRP